ncbi:multidrug MFS transporter [Paenibacillus bovis]|uniref:Multidrug MFS transporter n=2 Tax=Paenibacillus bovis TaxID=1616788 RepID=A0A172ZDE5_9BACL|nr:MFS transporter [Paenibacillus bovis]ANF95533.1 multidrug MFS transporter [Paenibacillus bovis]
MNLAKSQLWTRNFISFSAVNFTMTLVFFLLNATITLYAIHEYHASTGEAGVIAGIFIIGSLLGRLLVGRLLQTKKLLVIWLILFIFTTLLYFLHFNTGFLMISRFLNGITVGVVTTIVSTGAVLGLPAARKGEGISYFAISTALATGIGPFIGLRISQNANFDLLFLFSFLLGIINLILALFLRFPASGTAGLNKKTGWRISDFIEPQAVPISILILIMTFSFSGIVSYLNVYASEIGLLDTASFFFMVYTLFVLISRPFTGRIMDKRGANIIVYPALLLFSAGMFLLSSATTSMFLLTAGALVALGFGNISSISQSIAIRLSQPHRIGLATATFFIFYDLGNGFGPFITGLLIPVTGYKGLYAILGWLVLVSTLLYYRLYGQNERSRPKTVDTGKR